MASRAWDLSLCAALAAATLLCALLGIGGFAPAALRAPVALPLVLVGCGWAFAAALRPSPGLPLEEHVLFALGLSVATAIVGGVALNITPWGLRALPWAVFESGVTLLCCVIALRRGYRRAPSLAWRAGRVGGLQAALCAVALAICVGAFAVARAGQLDSPGKRFTQFTMVNASTATEHRARIEVDNQEARSEVYRVRVIQGTAVLQEWPAIDLAVGQSWQATLILPASDPVVLPIDAYLYRSEAPDTPYRSVSLVRAAAP